MTFAADLLVQARLLATKEPRRPKQASLRRAVSTGYYALFHLLVAEAAGLFRGGESIRRVVARTPSHGEMNAAAKSVGGGTFPSALARAAGGKAAVPPRLRNVASTFVDLQQARHEADYDLDRVFSKGETKDLLDQVDGAFRDWARVRKTAEARAFLVGLLFFNTLKGR